jgi:hypothetical protein
MYSEIQRKHKESLRIVLVPAEIRTKYEIQSVSKRATP